MSEAGSAIGAAIVNHDDHSGEGLLDEGGADRCYSGWQAVDVVVGSDNDRIEKVLRPFHHSCE